MLRCRWNGVGVGEFCSSDSFLENPTALSQIRPCLIRFRLFALELLTTSLPLRLGTESSVGLLVASEIDMIGGVCMNVQDAEWGLHVGVSQVTHVHMQYEVVSLADSHWTPLQRSCGTMQLNYTNTYTQIHTQTHGK